LFPLEQSTCVFSVHFIGDSSLREEKKPEYLLQMRNLTLFRTKKQVYGAE
jgi:hypothetical protein